MATDLKLPELGENIESGNVVKVLVSVGDKIEQDQPVLELETDKATIEVPSSVTGVVKEILVKEGATANVGETVMRVDTDGGQPAEQKAEPARVEQVTKPAREQKAARGKEKITDRQAKKETQKKVDASLEETPAVEEAEVRPGVTEPEDAPPEKEEIEETPPEAVLEEQKIAPEPATEGRVAPASPSVRRLAREIGVDIHEVKGSGPGGRISIEDVKEHSREMLAGSGAPKVIAAALPNFAKWGDIERKPMSGIRRTTAERLSIAWNTVPAVTQYDKADITDLENHRKRFGPKADAAGGKLTVTAILVKVVSAAIKAFPQFNASVDVARNEIVYKKYVHIGVAVDTEYGLLVPVIRDVDRKNILQLSVEISQAAEKARNKKLSLDEMQGGCFTVTNLGGIGGTAFSPIVNYPEVAILGVSRSSVEPVYKNNQFVPRTILPLSLSYDHRLIDGADAARFLRWCCQALEDPFLIALEG